MLKYYAVKNPKGYSSKFADIIGDNKFDFAKGDNVEEEENKEFEDFEV